MEREETLGLSGNGLLEKDFFEGLVLYPTGLGKE